MGGLSANTIVFFSIGSTRRRNFRSHEREFLEDTMTRIAMGCRLRWAYIYCIYSVCVGSSHRSSSFTSQASIYKSIAYTFQKKNLDSHTQCCKGMRKVLSNPNTEYLPVNILSKH